MKVAILTPKGFSNFNLLQTKCDHILKNKLPHLDIITWGNESSNLVRSYAKLNNVSCSIIPFSYTLNKRRAQTSRLKKIDAFADHYILFNDGSSPTIERIIKSTSKPIRVINL